VRQRRPCVRRRANAMPQYLACANGRSSRRGRSGCRVRGSVDTSSSAPHVVEQRTPTVDDNDRTWRLVFIGVHEVNAAAIGRNVVLSAPVSESDRRNCELDRQSKCWNSIRPMHRYAEKPSLRINKEQLPPVTAPDRLIAAVARDHNTSRSAGDTPDGHLRSSLATEDRRTKNVGD